MNIIEQKNKTPDSTDKEIRTEEKLSKAINTKTLWSFPNRNYIHRK